MKETPIAEESQKTKLLDNPFAKSKLEEPFVLELQKDLVSQMSTKEKAAMKETTSIGKESESQIVLLDNPVAKAELEEQRTGDPSLLKYKKLSKKEKSKGVLVDAHPSEHGLIIDGANNVQREEALKCTNLQREEDPSGKLSKKEKSEEVLFDAVPSEDGLIIDRANIVQEEEASKVREERKKESKNDNSVQNPVGKLSKKDKQIQEGDVSTKRRSERIAKMSEEAQQPLDGDESTRRRSERIAQMRKSEEEEEKKEEEEEEAATLRKQRRKTKLLSQLR